MKNFILILGLIASSTVYGQVMQTTLQSEHMVDTVGALNQVTSHTDEIWLLTDQQEQQEKLYEEDQKREKERWEKDKKIDDARVKASQR
jgi:hypothetical protein